MPAIASFAKTRELVPDDLRQAAKIRVLFRILAVILGLAETIAARNSIGPDGRSFLEIARAYLRHDWAMAINAYWSPLYSWLSAAVLGLTKPSWRWEYPTIHAMNFVIYLAAIAAFEFFWEAIPENKFGLSNSLRWVFGYALFLWLTLAFLSIVNPDLCVAVMVFLIAGLSVRIRNVAATKYFVWLGAALAVGYFAKAILFPMAFIFLLALALARVTLKKIALAAAIFLVIAAPEIILLSHAKGHLTFSESGPLTLAWSNLNAPIRNWQGQPSGSGTPLHPTRKIYDHPAVFEFNGPIRASYPPWYDPSYWNAGLHLKFAPMLLAKHALHNARQILSYFLQPKIWAAVMLILLLLGSRSTFSGIANHWLIFLPAIAAFGMYALTFAEFRYMPAWEMLVWAAFLSGLRFPENSRNRARILPWLAGITAVVMIFSSANGIRAQFVSGRHDDATPDYQTVVDLHQLGVHAGEKVAAIGFNNDAHWAYLARLSIVAEIEADQTCEFWSAGPAVQAQILEKLKQAGAVLVVANVSGGMRSTSYNKAPNLAACTHSGAGWVRLPNTNLVYFLR